MAGETAATRRKPTEQVFVDSNANYHSGRPTPVIRDPCVKTRMWSQFVVPKNADGDQVIAALGEGRVVVPDKGAWARWSSNSIGS
jgi:hypothetical protein